LDAPIAEATVQRLDSQTEARIVPRLLVSEEYVYKLVSVANKKLLDNFELTNRFHENMQAKFNE
jgi:tRNA(Phe) wybutosine-synthesizing methylase Tyw3